MTLAPFAILTPWSGVLRVVLALALAALAWLRAGTVIGGLTWIAVLGFACHGWGVAFERLVRRRVSSALTVVTGLALVLVVATPLGAAGLLATTSQLAFVVVGVVLNVLPRLGVREVPASASIRVLAVVGSAAVLLCSIAFVLRDVVIEDGFDHTFVLARLWQTGQLFPIFHQAGAQVVGESLTALAVGAEAAAAYELGACTSLLLFLLATELGAGRTPVGTLLFTILAVPIVLDPANTPEWSGTLFHVAAFAALRSAPPRRIAWHAIVCGLALALVRHEYAVLAVPLTAAAVVLPRTEGWSRRGRLVALLAWVAVLVPFQIALAVTPLRAIVLAVLLLGAVPLARVAAYLAGRDGRDPLGVVLFGAATWLLAIQLGAIRPAQQSDAALYTVGFGVVACICLCARGVRRVTPIALGATLAGFLALALLPATMDYDRRDLVGKRLYRALLDWRHASELGARLPSHEAIRALQAQVPARTRVGFWGTSAALLDHARHRLRDVTWPVQPRRTRYFLMPLVPSSLRGLDYVIVENMPARETPDAWDTARGPTDFVSASLVLVAENEHGRAYRVER